MSFLDRFRRPRELVLHGTEFVGEQDGPVERELKSALAELFVARGGVVCAFLVRTRTRESPGGAVVLAVRTQRGPDMELVREVGSVFAARFAVEAHLDVMFLDESKQAAVARVCRPFFDRA